MLGGIFSTKQCENNEHERVARGGRARRGTFSNIARAVGRKVRPRRLSEKNSA